MKCPKAEKTMLLRDSGELSARKAAVVGNHLDRCTPCREFHRALVASGNVYFPMEEPGLKTLQNVVRAARLNAPVRKPARVWGLKPVLAMAASLAIILGVFLSNVSSDKVGMIYTVTETQLLDPDDQVVSVMYEGLSEDDLAFNFLMTYRDNG